MRLTLRLGLISLLAVLLLTGCGGLTISTSESQGQGTVVLTVSDVPPAGVTVLSFQLTVTGAVLDPGNVSLVSAPITVDVARLQAEAALLSLSQVPGGDYSSITLTFASPQLAIINNSAVAVANCAPGAVCKIQSSLTSTSVTYSASPFPVTVSAGSSTGLHLDFNLSNSLQSDLSATPTITFSEFLPGSSSAPIEKIDSLLGVVKSVDAAQQQFTLQPGEPGPSNNPPLTVAVDDQTQFVYFDQIGLPNDFSSVAVVLNRYGVEATVEIDATVAAGGTLLARKIVFKQQPMPNERGGGGTIVSLPNPPAQFNVEMFEDLLGGITPPTSAPGTVMLDTGTQFSVDAQGLTLPAGFSFASANDLLVGQNASANVALILQFIADQVVLERSVLTATVKSVSGTTLVLDNLPGLFAAAGITEIQVATSTQTDFRNVSGAGGLSPQDEVSIRGFLFKTSGGPVLLADIVRKQ
jgi:uncharacterized protein DUF4382/uncharacterized protein DUF5666